LPSGNSMTCLFPASDFTYCNLNSQGELIVAAADNLHWWEGQSTRARLVTLTITGIGGRVVIQPLQFDLENGDSQSVTEPLVLILE
jgi:hypothetical protein